MAGINFTNEEEYYSRELTFKEDDVKDCFYCNEDDGDYNNNPCAKQCNFCKGVEELNSNKQ